MTDIQMGEKSSKKKLLVPLVVLMLCAVSVIGAGYAYSTTVTNNNNALASEYYSIDIYNNSNTCVTGAISFSGKIDVYTQKTDNNINILASVTNGDLGKVAAFYNSDSPSSNLAPSITMDATVGNGFTETDEGSNIWTKTISGCAVTMTFTLQADDTTDNSTDDGDGYREILLAITITQGSATGSAVAAAKAVSDAINASTYSLAFEYVISS